MTISLVPEDTRARRFTCVGGETVFNVTFPVFAASDVQVLRLRAGVTVTLTNPGDYTLSGIGAPGGFTVTLTAPALADDLIVVVSAQPVARSSEWTDGQALRAAALNAEFARWWIALQQLKRDVTRTVRLPLTDPSAGLELPAANVRAGKFLGFNAAGAAVAMGAPDAPLGAVARSGDTMTGPLTLHADPTAPMHAATRQYADRSGPGGYSGLIATPSGMAYDVTGIPSWANVIEVLFIDIPAIGPDYLYVRLGTSSGFVTTGYRSGYGSRIGEISETAAFVASHVNAVPMNGIMRIVNVGSNTWVQAVCVSEPGYAFGGGSGRVNIGGALTQIRVFTNSQPFAGGGFVVRWTA